MSKSNRTSRRRSRRPFKPALQAFLTVGNYRVELRPVDSLYDERGEVLWEYDAERAAVYFIARATAEELGMIFGEVLDWLTGQNSTTAAA